MSKHYVDLISYRGIRRWNNGNSISISNLETAFKSL